MRLAWLVVMTLVLLPAVTARPDLLPVEVGYATPGSHEDWYDPTPQCDWYGVTIRVTLTIVTGAPTDKVTLAMLGQSWSNASLGHPAIVEGTFGTPCSLRFIVEGADVETIASYRLDIQQIA